MALARYTYLAWLRRGAANAILAPAAAKSRAEIKVSLALSDGSVTGAPIEKTFKLMGPGDIVGIGPDLVVRTEPRNWVTDFEPNYLPFIEFYDEDFPWRHTPAPADASHRLTPWLSLLVLAEGEFDRDSGPGRPLTSVIVKAPDPASFFPPADQLWAWAHVQVTGDVGGTGRPTSASSRRASRVPRTAAFRGSFRRGGSNPTRPIRPSSCRPSKSAARQGSASPSTMTASPAPRCPGAAAGEFPIYYEWYFRTGEGGDFEDLVQRIVPRKVDERVGVRDMDIAAPGFGMPIVAEAIGPGDPPSHHEGVVGLEGALKAPDMKPKPLDARSHFPQKPLGSSMRPTRHRHAGRQRSGRRAATYRAAGMR